MQRFVTELINLATYFVHTHPVSMTKFNGKRGVLKHIYTLCSECLRLHRISLHVPSWW